MRDGLGKLEPAATERAFFRVLMGLTVIVVLTLCSANETVRIPIKKEGAGPLFQIHHGTKWGYMDRNGKTVISPQFDDEGDFFSGLARVRIGWKWGYVNDTGRLATRVQFENAGDFKEGLAPVQVERRWGFIDTGGGYAIEPQFQAAAEFSDGLARFEVWDTIHCYPLDYKKKSPESYTRENAPLYAFVLHDTMPSATGCFPQNAQYGFVDKHGIVAVAPRFLVARDFSEGLAPVRTEQSFESKYGYIGKTGEMVIGPQFDQAYSFSEGLAAVEVGFRAGAGKRVAGHWGFINREGKFVIPPRFELVGSFSEGLAAVSPEPGVWGYVDKRGLLAIPPRYSDADAFSDGVALVSLRDEESSYYIDKTGKLALVLALEPQWPFSDGLTVAGDNGQQKYVDRKGRVVAPYEIDPR